MLGEQAILRELGFVLHTEHPHKYILNYVTILSSAESPHGLAQRAWNYLNDRYPPPSRTA